MPLFQHSVINKYLAGLGKPALDDAYSRFSGYFLDPQRQRNIRNAKEEQYQEGFLRELFVQVLGYTLNPDPGFNLTTEHRNVKDSRKADGAILSGDAVKAVIELKGTEVTDLARVEPQAFGYKNNQPGCRYVIVSNFEKIRFYIDNAVDHIEFNLFTLTRQEFDLLWLCLSQACLMQDLPARIKEESLSHETEITRALYRDYSLFKRELHQNLTALNPQFDPLTLFKKSQKLLSRLLFLFFAEDRNLLPPNSVRLVLGDWRDLKERDAEVPLYDRFKKYFGYLNSGFKGKRYDVFAYNGGLFKPDLVLDAVRIDDELLYRHTLKLSEYDFISEIDVNILGHIFENSLNELDEIRAQLEGTPVDKAKTKRKKEGVYYTPKYITKYIVENTVGRLCREKREELAIVDEDFTDAVRRQTKTRQALLDKLTAYREWLLQLTICDPACGSGAFLNQALEFLIAEHHAVDELQSRLFGDAMVLSDLDKSILENNLYGVDLNEESVEIARLSLWLRTARPNRTLNDLSANIKVGNSLIDDPAVAGDKAFDWHKEFPHVFAKGGFDVVIGNPPYGILMDKQLQNYYNEKFPLTRYKTNYYVLFIERMTQVFSAGNICFIIPKSLLFNIYYQDIRKYLLQNTQVIEFFTITEKVFADAEVGGSLILNFIIKKEIDQNQTVRLASIMKCDEFPNGNGLIENKIPQNQFFSIPNCEISIIPDKSQSIVTKLTMFKPLKTYYVVKNGLNPGNIKNVLISNSKDSENHKAIIWGKDITRYSIDWSGQFINYDNSILERINLDSIQSKAGMNKQNKIDFALRSIDLFETEKVLVRKTGDSLIASNDNQNFFFDTLVHGIYEKTKDFPLEYILAILNSNPATIFYRILHDIKGKVFAKISLENLAEFPIPTPEDQQLTTVLIQVKSQTTSIKLFHSLTSSFHRTLQRHFGLEVIPAKLQHWYQMSYGDFVKELQKKKVKLTLAQEAEWEPYFMVEAAKAQELKRTIDATDQEIDRMVYELYGLTEEEIAVVEKNQ